MTIRCSSAVTILVLLVALCGAFRAAAGGDVPHGRSPSVGSPSVGVPSAADESRRAEVASAGQPGRPQTPPDHEARDLLETIAGLRLRGALDEARALAERALSSASAGTELQSGLRFELHLELARIHDRVGLHHNSRPVEQALAEIGAAEGLIEDTEDASPGLRGAIELAKGDYYYRAEMSERRFPAALEHVEEAIRLLESAGDTRRLAEAVHRLGLIRMQRRELAEARRLFDRSLALDDAAGRRDFFHGEYHRHVGFVYWLSDDIPAALPHLRKSLDFRRRAGAIDASLFAAVSLGSALVETGSPREAQQPLIYALDTARELKSPVGTARAAIALGAMHTALDDPASARTSYELARDTAQTVGLDSIATRAREALKEIEAGSDPGNAP